MGFLDGGDAEGCEGGRTLIPEPLWLRLQETLAAVRAGAWNGGAQIVLNVSPQGVVTSLEVKCRLEGRESC
mgnify:CR=1 FL=1